MASRLLLLAAIICAATALAAAQKKKAPVAPGPAAAPPPTNLTAVLEKSGHYATFIRLLKESRVDTQINSQLNNSYNGLTVFAPTDSAFAALKAGTLNGLTQQEQIAVVLYHCLPRFYSLAMFNTISNPVNTQASGADGPYAVHIKSSSSAVNVSTGVNWATIAAVESKDFPLAVYSIEKVLLPYELFGPKPPAPAPAPAKASSKKKPKSKSGIAEPPVADADAADTKKSAAAGGGAARWVVGLGVVGGVLAAGGLL